MKAYFSRTVLGATISLALALPNAGLASEEENQAIKLCESKILDVYKVDKFRHVWAEQVGNHKFKVHGKVKYEGDKHPFDCKVKHGNIKSYHYDGPHPALNENDDVSVGTALAVGAGLAILAAVAAQSDDDQDSGLSGKKSVLEDECLEALSYRLRDERHHTADVRIKSSKLDGRTLTGEAKVYYGHERPHHANYTCHFDRNGRVHDSQYYLY